MCVCVYEHYGVIHWFLELIIYIIVKTQIDFCVSFEHPITDLVISGPLFSVTNNNNFCNF